MPQIVNNTRPRYTFLPEKGIFSAEILDWRFVRDFNILEFFKHKLFKPQEILDDTRK